MDICYKAQGMERYKLILKSDVNLLKKKKKLCAKVIGYILCVTGKKKKNRPCIFVYIK